MLKIIKRCVFAAVLLMLLSCGSSRVMARNLKLALTMPFVYFNLEDVFHQRWVSTHMRGKPIILLTAQTSQRKELARWAEGLKREYALTGRAYVLWVANLKRYSGKRSRAADKWRAELAPVPILLDWHGVIGNALRINYNVPNIILIDAYGRFIMHEMATYSPEMYSAVSLKIQSLLGYVPQPQPQPIPQPEGEKGDSY